MDHLALYSRKCKRCSHLDPEEEQSFDCHYTQGNTECPAKEIQIAIVGEAKRLARRLTKAKAAGDMKTEIKILQHVEGRSEAFQHKFRDWQKP